MNTNEELKAQVAETLAAVRTMARSDDATDADTAMLLIRLTHEAIREAGDGTRIPDLVSRRYMDRVTEYEAWVRKRLNQA